MYSVVAELTFSFCHLCLSSLGADKAIHCPETLVKFLSGFHVKLPGFYKAVSRFLRLKHAITTRVARVASPPWLSKVESSDAAALLLLFPSLVLSEGEMKIDKVGLAPDQIPTYFRGIHNTLFSTRSQYTHEHAIKGHK